MLDIEAILTQFVETARGPTYSPPLSVEAIGGLKNVYRERPDDVAKADYPYILVDLLSIEKESGWIIDNLEIDVNDNVVYKTNYELVIAFHIYGSGARAIANQLEGYLRFEGVRNNIETNTGGVVVTTLPIESVPQQLADKFVDSAILNVLFAINDSAADTTSTIIDFLNIDGQLVHAGYDSASDDPAPLPVDVDIDYTAP
jgi:hypothetical protein